jgi:protein-L-isoaspartate(D-aspartate) O-methyltransferase
MNRPLLLLYLVLAFADPLSAQTRRQYEQARLRMVEDAIVGAGVKDPRVIQAMRDTPRHEFVPLHLRKKAYYDMSLPIGARQTISSPFIVAYMTESLDPQPSDKVLEIGTGSGFQAAVLSPLVKEVYTIEIVESLGRSATRTLKRLDYTNVYTKVGDGFLGWPQHAPFDKIVVTCSPERVPQPLIDQLREGGLMVIPVGQRYQQTLYLLRKKDGKLESEALRPTLFVPMTGEAEDRRRVAPDPADPKAINGDFEQQPGENGFLTGWYYQRQLSWESAADAPEGEHYITIRNEESGRAAHVMQGFPVDGREVSKLDLLLWVRYEDVQRGRTRQELPMAAISFYDPNRKEVGFSVIGPFLGSASWRRYAKAIRVPIQAREGILRLGLFGATGQISFDDVQMRASKG